MPATAWKMQFDIKALWADAQADKVTPKEFCEKIAVILKEKMPLTKKTLGDHAENELEEIINEFEILAPDEEISFDMVDSLMSELYDFGDRERVWIDK